MKKLVLTIMLICGVILLSGCSNSNKERWQGAYFGESTNEADLVYSSIFTNFEACKNWAISKTDVAYEGYTYCSKNCHNSDDGTAICEEVVTCYDEKGGRCGNYESDEDEK